MIRKGKCWNNAPIERIFSTGNVNERGDRLYQTRQAVIADVR